MFLTEFLTVIVVHLLAVVSPGPDFAMTVKNSLSYGRRIGIYTSIGMGLGIGVHVFYSLVGVGLIISQSILVFNIIKYLGAAYLIYLGIKALKSKPANSLDYQVNLTEEKISNLKAIGVGFLTNVLNPKATLFFLSLFTQVINPDTPILIQTLYGAEMILATIAWFSIVAIFFSHQLFKEKIIKFKHHLERAFGVILIGLGIKVAISSRD